jgi:tRNA(adenine34) deaminase
MIKHHEKYMTMAIAQAREALAAGEFPVGCVFEYDGNIVASARRSNSFGRTNEIDHAEILALRALLAGNREIEIDRVTVYSTMEPCLMCFATMLVNGVRRFAYSFEDAMGGGTNLPLQLLSPLYREMNVVVAGGILRRKSLALFKEFFSSPDCAYLQDSLLASYTLNQEI